MAGKLVSGELLAVVLYVNAVFLGVAFGEEIAGTRTGKFLGRCWERVMQHPTRWIEQITHRRSSM